MTAVGGLLLLGLGVTQGVTARCDRLTLEALAALRGPGPDAFFLAVTWLGSSYVLAPAAILTMTALAARRQWAAARLLGLTYFGASLTTWLLKPAIGRKRPMLGAALAQVGPADWSFPSGHATHAAAFSLGLWLLLREGRARWQWPAAAGLGASALLVATSRLHLQAHWPSDVLAGLLVAILWAGVAVAIADRHAGSV